MTKCFCAIFTLLLLIVPFDSNAGESGETWMEIYSGDSKVGHSYRKISSKNGLTRSEEKTVIKLVLLGTETEMDISSDYILNGQKIRSFEYDVSSDSIGLSLEGKLEGNRLTITDKQSQGTHVYKLNHDYILPSLLPEYLYKKGLKEASSHIVYIFDPVNIYLKQKLRF